MQISFISPKNFILASFKSQKVLSPIIKPAIQMFNRSVQTSSTNTLNPSRITIEEENKIITQFFSIVANGTNIEETFFTFVENKNVAFVKSMLQAGIVDATSKTGTEALDLAMNYSSEIVDLLLVYGAKVIDLPRDHRGDPLWRKACRGSSTLLIKELLRNKLLSVNDCDAVGNTPMKLACSVNSPVIKVLLEHGAELNPKLIFDLKLGFNRQDVKANYLLLSSFFDYGLNPNACLKNGYSLLHSALDYHDVGMVKIILEAGANIDIECNDISPLYFALESWGTTGYLYYEREKLLDQGIKYLLSCGIKTKQLTKREAAVVSEFQRRSKELSSIPHTNALNLLMNHNPEVERLVHKLISQDKDRLVNKS